jgi:hypothetical protein
MYSSSGIYQFPTLTDAALQRKDGQYASRVLGWLSDAIIEGDAVNTQDPNYDKIAQSMRYVSGDQQPSPDSPGLPQFMEPMIFNFCEKALKAHASALTDLKPTFGWRSLNPKYQMHAQQLNLLSIAWWLNNQADLSFGDVVKMAWAAGTGDMMIEWNPGLPGGGDHQVIPKDPRDTLPWRPGRYGDEQTWQGAIFREIWSVNSLREKYPYAAAAITTTDDSLLGSIKGIFFRRPQQFQTPADPLSNLGGGARMAGPPRSGDCILYRAYLDDRTRNLGSRPIVMGEKSFQYTVEPGGYMYPTKRLVVSTQDLILYDGPNPYWHGKFPFARLHLWKLPWHFLGQSQLASLTGVQNAINLAGKHMKMGIEQWMDRQVVLDRNAVSEATAKSYDSRKPGFTFKLKTNVVDPSKVVTKLDGPNPQVLAQNFQWFTSLKSDFQSLAGTGNLEALLQMRSQLPAGDTLEKYQEMLTPELRMEGRMMEAFLRRASAQLSFNTFQFMDSAKRIAILGDAGALLEDFDYEPDSLIPAMSNTMPQQVGVDPLGAPMLMHVPNPDYDPAFDKNLPRSVRAQTMAKLMVFVVAPNSVLAFNAQQEKMMKFQLARMGYYDAWSLAEAMEIPNFGSPPPMPLPPMPPLKPEQTATPEALMLLLAQNPGKYIMDPASGQILEMRVPITVVERLQAQMMMGIGMTENPAGRKASGGDTPKQEEKSDGNGGTRTTTTESKK